MNVGDTVFKHGFFTKAHWLRMHHASEVERRVGYRAGRLAQGWYLLFLLQMPAPNQFEFRGYSYLSGGVSGGHQPNPPDPRTSEQRLIADGYDIARLKRNLIENVFRLHGPDRLAKVVPVLGEFQDNDYPPGSGIPQWVLTADLPFKVAAFIGPGETYQAMYT